MSGGGNGNGRGCASVVFPTERFALRVADAPRWRAIGSIRGGREARDARRARDEVRRTYRVLIDLVFVLLAGDGGGHERALRVCGGGKVSSRTASKRVCAEACVTRENRRLAGGRKRAAAHRASVETHRGRRGGTGTGDVLPGRRHEPGPERVGGGAEHGRARESGSDCGQTGAQSRSDFYLAVAMLVSAPRRDSSSSRLRCNRISLFLRALLRARFRRGKVHARDVATAPDRPRGGPRGARRDGVHRGRGLGRRVAAGG